MQAHRPPSITYRRVIFGLLVLFSLAAMASLMAYVLAPGGFNGVKLALLACFLITLPWLVVGFWHAVIGFGIMVFARDPAGLTCPIDPARASQGIPERAAALLSCIRNENVQEVERKLDAMVSGLVTRSVEEGFALYVLSDTSDDRIAEEEAEIFEAMRQRWQGRMNVVYRRRTVNAGYKAGNIADFCARWGHLHRYAITLDADSYLAPETLVALVQRMEANPQVGILQTLAVGLPSKALFARVFQWGMRLGMRSYTLAAAWWQGDCGPYWGHNAILRLEPFRTQCMLDPLPGRGPLAGAILSHDQIEAVLMRKAGFEVRVWPVEDGSYEENPPNLIEYVRRDLRWCHGNLQYVKLLTLKGLKLVSRIQLLMAILMYVSSIAWMAFIAITVYASLAAPPETLQFDSGLGMVMFAVVMTMVFAPKVSSLCYVMMSTNRRKGFGGGVRVGISAICEVLFTMLLAPLMAITHTLFVVMLFAGARVGWQRQERLPKGVSWAMAMRKFWPQFGLGCLGIWWASQFPLAMQWLFLPIVTGPALVLPFTVFSSMPSLGAIADRYGFWRLPEEREQPAEFRLLENRGLATEDLQQSRPAVLPR